MNWNRETGIWNWWIFRGTTPRNAGVWTLDVVVGKYELWMATGKHAYINFFVGPTEKWAVERTPKKCDCYGCSMRMPTDPKILAAMKEAMENGPHKHLDQKSLDLCKEPEKCAGKLGDPR